MCGSLILLKYIYAVSLWIHFCHILCTFSVLNQILIVPPTLMLATHLCFKQAQPEMCHSPHVWAGLQTSGNLHITKKSYCSDGL